MTAAPHRGPVRVVIGHPFGDARGGAERLLMDLLEHRDEAGIEPLLLCFEPGRFVDRARALGIETLVIAPGRFRAPWRLVRTWFVVARKLRAWRPDVCVSWLPRVQTVLAPAAALAGVRDRVVYVEQEITTGDILHRVAVALPCAKVIAVSCAAGEATHRLWPHREHVVVSPGLTVPRRPSPPELETLRTELAIPAERPIVGTIGRLVRYKRQDEVIRAVGVLRDRGVDVTLLVVGDEAHGVDAGFGTELRALVTELGLHDRVVFTGHVEAPHRYIALCDVTVSGAEREAFGLVFVESMALGVPVVAVARGGPLDIVEPGVSGVLVPTGTAEDLAEGVGRLMADAPRRARLIDAGSRRARDVFTVEAMAARFGRELAAAVPAGHRS